MRSYYSAYVRHCIRYYVRYPEPDFRSEAERLDWMACDNVFSDMGSAEAIVREIYLAGKDELPEKIKEIAARENVPRTQLWKLVNEVEEEVAKNRGLR